MSTRIKAWGLLSSLLLIAGCTSLPIAMPTSTLNPADIPTMLPRLTATSNLAELQTSPEPSRTLASSLTPSPSASPAPSLRWEPVGLFFEEQGSIYRADFDGSNKQLLIPGENLISVSPDGMRIISSYQSQAHLVSSTGGSVELPPASAFWSPDSSALILLHDPEGPQGQSEYERWSTAPAGLQRQFQVDGEFLPIGIGSQGNLLLETLNASDYDPGPLDYAPGYYAYDDRSQQLLPISTIDQSVEPIAVGGRRYAALSPSGEKMAVSLDGINIWVLDLQSRRLILKTRFSRDPYPGGVGRIVWSPDEGRLALEQVEIYQRDTGKWENRVAIIDLESDKIAMVSDESVFGLADLPYDFPLRQSFFQPAGWNESGDGLLVYFEVTALEGAQGHRDHPDYPEMRRIHSFWLLSLDTLELEAIPWLEDTHAIFPRYNPTESE